MKIGVWILAARPKTLPAAIAPVLVGTALAAHDGQFAATPAFICLAFALLIQIGTNFANDYFDFVQGADNEQRIGPTRAVAAGLISPKAMRYATIVVLTLAFLVGMFLVYWGGAWLVLVGLVSIFCAITYTGGPYPLGYNGLGDVFVFIFFGLVAVGFTYYVQAGAFSSVAWMLGAGVGALSTNLLVINNYRDVETDRAAGKRTLVVRWGRSAAWWQYVVSVLLAMAVPAMLVIAGYAWTVLLPLAMTPLGVFLCLLLKRSKTRADFQLVLAQTAKMLLFYSGLLSIGLVL
ncbi:1,4-dihydroxy-2-naphthoate polyprenyltransferase [Cerasicoccus arenae]|uniref:1,4-dihydroxy-2-naphthoate octaprenyltransferase n=1 Tax=Cerasicoccus arenae TaxID=424488 RepID=A0A8J3GEN3_9BACT|nr:1,4-dihydroxy-2-naphthoate polyprenyltransferase [Cerasicoccus arenae]MBK1857221.1 1,4-dihydroxy-2-naphthoate polyprenyltransferase [Cerasicoccus arenae]GHC00087.1 1,4-dihydroxy-2-naphthoate polyprenyltransferase [Cerasicoccus arenae]